ncbi:Centrosomal protein of 295 kDa [Frankliniella fusca]|uniref:Centrosomal protein of 295 kDa n=1 Tax=Frankliniella fusca TaxID=407009 RepID=A0AAE1I3S0_9NEOP|nr:Centrosomal protein of 295 kDa [Frankliniella fusca]
MTDKSGGSRNPHKSFKDIETLKREELNRRRLLRYEQVRQQSKELANLVRQKVNAEREKQIGLVQERVEARTQQWKVRKLKALQSEYENTIKCIGKSHAEATSLPDEEALRKIEAEKTFEAAQRRGQEALNSLREEEAARRRVDDERRQHMIHTRAVEEARSAAVVALPKPDSTVGIKSIPAKASVPVISLSTTSTTGKIVSKNTIPEWPKRTWPTQSLPLGIISTECLHKHGDAVQSSSGAALEYDALPSQTKCMPVSSHGDAMDITSIRDVPPSSQSFKLGQPASLMTSATRSDVKLYDYTSCYQSQYDKTCSIVRKVQETEEVNANEAAKKEICAEVCSKSNAVEREQLRSREALQRVQVQRDYKDIMGSLSMLAKQNAALCSYSDIPHQSYIQTKSRDEKLSGAVENLLLSVNLSSSDGPLETSSNSTDGSLIVSQLGDTPSSVPRLNVGRCQRPNLTAEHVQPSKENSLSTSSIVIAPPIEAPNSTITSREENLERDLALRNLVRQINYERQSLISSRQPIDSSQTNPNEIFVDSNDLDAKMLEKRVLLQRQQLREQRSEVKHLNESIVVPECMKQPEVDRVLPSNSSSLTHESIIIEASQSEEFQNISSSSPLHPVEKLPHKIKKHRKRKDKSSEEALLNSPMKDNMKYSLDVSLSSVIMDQTESSSSGSKSLSLHGVQVLVKLCGAEQESSESTSQENKTVNVKEVLSDDYVVDTLESRVKHTISEKNVKGLKQSIKKRGSKKKKEVSYKKVPEPPKTVSSKVSQKHKNHHQDVKATALSTESIDKDGKKVTSEGVNAAKQEKKAAKPSHRDVEAGRDRPDQPESTSTSYLSPPDRVISSLTEDIKALIALAQSNIQTQSKNSHNLSRSTQIQNQPLGQYINRLLAMSRESIDRLNVSCSDVSTPSSAIFQSSRPENEVNLNLTDIGFTAPPKKGASKLKILEQDQVNDTTECSDIFGSDNTAIPSQLEVGPSPTYSELNDNITLTDLTQQCHEKISALTRMIEEVRRETVVSSSSHSYSVSDKSSIPNQSKSPMHFDSTTYMSPPPQVLEWADIAFPSGYEDTSGMSLDPYGTAVMQLLADVRSQMIQKTTDPSIATELLQSNHSQERSEFLEANQNRPKPPVAFWKNIERCNVSSPTEPHELSTIPELGTTLPESDESPDPEFASPVHAHSRPSTPGTPPDVIAELMRRKLLTSPFIWAKKKNKSNQHSKSSSKNSLDSDLSSVKSGAEQSDISASKETNTLSVPSRDSSSNASRDWKTNILMSPVDLCSSADEVDGDFRKMGIGWVGAMLRKTKEAGALSSTSGSDGSPVKIDSSDFKVLSKMVDNEPVLSSPLLSTVTQGRLHSTPVKHLPDHSSSSDSPLV